MKIPTGLDRDRLVRAVCRKVHPEQARAIREHCLGARGREQTIHWIQRYLGVALIEQGTSPNDRVL